MCIDAKCSKGAVIASKGLPAYHLVTILTPSSSRSLGLTMGELLIPVHINSRRNPHSISGARCSSYTRWDETFVSLWLYVQILISSTGYRLDPLCMTDLSTRNSLKDGGPAQPPDILVAEAGFEPTTFGLWARRADHCSTPQQNLLRTRTLPLDLLVLTTSALRLSYAGLFTWLA